MYAVGARRLRETGLVRDQIRMAAQLGPLASAWLKVAPSPEVHTDLSNGDFQLLSKFWLGLELLSGYKCPVHLPRML